MQSTYPDGSESFRTGTRIEADMERSKVFTGKLRGFMAHPPGSRVAMPSGARYEVQADGSWKRLHG